MGRKLKYLGNDLPDGHPLTGAFIPGVPAGDHTSPSEKQAEALIASGLYAYANKRPDSTEGEEE